MPNRRLLSRTRQRFLTGWLVFTGLLVGLLLGMSMWWRLQSQFQAARDYLGWAVVIMLLSVYVSEAVKDVRRVPLDDTVPCCTCCKRDLEIPKLPPEPRPLR